MTKCNLHVIYIKIYIFKILKFKKFTPDMNRVKFNPIAKSIDIKNLSVTNVKLEDPMYILQ